jgi:hypothetical protein
MNVVGRFKKWRNLRGRRFDEAIPALSVGARIDAAEYELQSIMRDIARVRLLDPHSITARHPGRT